MNGIRLYEEELAKLIHIIFIPYPIDLGNFTLRVLNDILPKVKDELNLDFDKIEVYPGPQPRESADIQLYRDGKLIRKINVKTSISGNLRRTLYKLYKSRKYDEDGLIIIFMRPTRKKQSLPIQMVIIYIPSNIFLKSSRQDILRTIDDKINAKMIRENFDSFYPIAVNEAIMFELAYKTITAAEKAEKARMEAEKARIEAEKARIEVEKTRIEVEKTRIEAGKAKEIAEKALNVSEEIKNIVKTILERIEEE